MTAAETAVERRISEIPPLSRGAHSRFEDGACVMEAASYAAGERWSDHPECACPTLARFLGKWNDRLEDAERDTILRPLIRIIVGSRTDRAAAEHRVGQLVDWVQTEALPIWLRAAGLPAEADAVAAAGAGGGGDKALEAAGRAAGAAAAEAGYRADLLHGEHAAIETAAVEALNRGGVEAALETAADDCLRRGRSRSSKCAETSARRRRTAAAARDCALTAAHRGYAAARSAARRENEAGDFRPDAGTAEAVKNILEPPVRGTAASAAQMVERLASGGC